MIQKNLRTHLLVIDEQHICHVGLARLLSDEYAFELLPLATSVVDALAAPQADMVVLDISAAKSKGIGAIRDIKARFPNAPILVLTSHDETLFAERCLKSGASGYLMKTATPAAILFALKEVARGSLHVSDQVKSLMLHRLSNARNSDRTPGFDRLSDRELLIVEQIGLSKNNKEIARELQISVKTIESHRSRIKAKLQLESPQDLMRYAMKLNQAQ